MIRIGEGVPQFPETGPDSLETARTGTPEPDSPHSQGPGPEKAAEHSGIQISEAADAVVKHDQLDMQSHPLPPKVAGELGQFDQVAFQPQPEPPKIAHDLGKFDRVAFQPQPEPPKIGREPGKFDQVAFQPQPEPPKVAHDLGKFDHVAFQPQPEPPGSPKGLHDPERLATGSAGTMPLESTPAGNGSSPAQAGVDSVSEQMKDAVVKRLKI